MSPARGSYPAGEAGGGEGASHPSPPRAGSRRHRLTHVLVIGGSGAQREEVGRTFHRESPLSAGPFVRVDCRTDVEALRQALEAWRTAGGGSHTNPLRASESGTLYLDQIEELPPDVQPLLLELAGRLQGELAGTEEWPCAGRLIAANSRSLARPVAEGRFDRALSNALDRVRVDLGSPPESGEGPP